MMGLGRPTDRLTDRQTNKQTLAPFEVYNISEIEHSGDGKDLRMLVIQCKTDLLSPP